MTSDKVKVMRFSKFSQYLQDLESTASRNKMTEILAELFKKAEVNEIDKICYLSLGRLAPKFTGIEFNLAEKMITKVISQAYQRREEEVKKKNLSGNEVSAFKAL